MLSWGESPMAQEVPAEWLGRICHASMSVGGSELAGVDDPFEEYERPRGFQLIVEFDEAAEARRVFAEMAAGGEVKVAMQRTFWSPSYGVLVDEFGVRWEMNCAGAES